VAAWADDVQRLFQICEGKPDVLVDLEADDLCMIYDVQESARTKISHPDYRVAKACLCTLLLLSYD
jgi:hypothetical protein